MPWPLVFFQAEDGIRDYKVTGVQTCALPISHARLADAQRAKPGPARQFQRDRMECAHGTQGHAGRDSERHQCTDEKYPGRSEEHTSELQSPCNLVCRLLLEKKKINLDTSVLIVRRDGVEEEFCVDSYDRV